MKTFSLMLILLSCSCVAFGQYGTAPNGYYPPRYNGETVSGKVTAADEASQQITISFEKGNKTETFVARLQEPCAVPSKDGKPMTALDLPIGTYVTAFYVTNIHKDGKASVKENSIIGLTFRSWDGHPVKQASQKMYLCSEAPISRYWRCFDTAGRTCVEYTPPTQ